MKTSDLMPPALDWAVAKAKQLDIVTRDRRVYVWTTVEDSDQYEPLTDWSQGGPIIEAEAITVTTIHDGAELWGAHLDDGNDFIDSLATGPAPLIAAMRCFVASKLGDEVEVPEELQ